MLTDALASSICNFIAVDAGRCLFLCPGQVTEEMRDGQKVTVSLESGHQVSWAEEDNYVFPMSRLRDDLRYYVKNREL